VLDKVETNTGNSGENRQNIAVANRAVSRRRLEPTAPVVSTKSFGKTVGEHLDTTIRDHFKFERVDWDTL